jgi:phage protein D
VTLPRPAAALTLQGATPPLGGGPLDAAQAAVRRIVVDLTADAAHDRAEVAVWRASPLADAAPGSTLTIGLGDAGQTQDVATVEVTAADVTGWGAILVGHAPSRRLSTTWVGKSYVDSSIGDIVSDLLGQGGVDEGEVDASLTLPLVHVDPRRSVWQHLHALARRCGCTVTSGADGSISFTPIPGAVAAGGLSAMAAARASAAGAAAGRALDLTPDAPGELREGAELIAFRVGRRPEDATIGSVTPVGSKAGLLLADPDSGGGETLWMDPLLRTKDAADAATTARKAAARRRARSATATVPGRPDLRAGAPVTLRGEDFRIVRARHVLDAQTGYLVDLVLEGAS